MPSLNNPYAHGQFFLNQFQIPDPLAGFQLSFTIPAGYSYELLSLSFLFTADANVANRIISLVAQTSTAKNLFRSTLQDPIIASASGFLSFGAGFAPRYAAAGVLSLEMSWPVGLIIPGSNLLKIIVTNIQIDDQISDVYVIAKQWFST